MFKEELNEVSYQKKHQLFLVAFFREKQEGMVKIESKEVKDIIDKEVTKCERRTAEVINQHVQR